MNAKYPIGQAQGPAPACALMLSVLAGLLFGLGAASAHAAPVAPLPGTLQQPDGTPFGIVPFGDERLHGVETADGYTLLKNPQTGFWVYARLNPQGNLVPSQRRAGIDPPPAVGKHLRPKELPPRGAPPSGVGPQAVLPQHAPSLGNGRMLVVLVRFSDQAPVGSTASDWSGLFFGGFPGLADYYDEVSYSQFSVVPAAEGHGTSNDGVVGWLNVGSAHPDTGFCIGYANSSDCSRADAQLIQDALETADNYVNFAAFDDNGDGSISSDELLIYVVAAGYEGAFGGYPSACLPNVWAHQSGLGYWYDVNNNGLVDSGEIVSAPTLDGVRVGHFSDSGYALSGEWHNLHPSPDPAHPSLPAECDGGDPVGHQATPGIEIHETGHLLELPDMYDVGCSDGSADGNGAGDWETMAGGSWNWGGSFSGDWATLGDRPAHLSAWSKWYKAWLTPTEITGSQTGVSIPRVEDAAGTNRGVYQLESNATGGHGSAVDWHFDGGAGGSGEYFLMENRQPVGYDTGLPGSGLLIWHIYEALPGDNCVNADQGTSPPGNPRLVVLEQADGNFDLECFNGTNCNGGDATDPWYSGNATTFDNSTMPDSKLYSGSASGTCITNIGPSGNTMTADMGVSGCPSSGTTSAAVFRVTKDGDVFSDRAYFCGLSSGCFNAGQGADIAERIDTSEPVEPGDLVAIDPQRPRHYRKTRKAYSDLAVGVVSTTPGVTLANTPEELEAMSGRWFMPVGSALVAQLLSLPPALPASLFPRLTLTALFELPAPAKATVQRLERHRREMARWSRLPGRPLMALMGRVPVKASTENGPIRPGDLLVSASMPGHVMRCPHPQRCLGALVGKALTPLEEGTGTIEMLVMR